jgi:hypothetical protein
MPAARQYAPAAAVLSAAAVRPAVTQRLLMAQHAPRFHMLVAVAARPMRAAAVVAQLMRAVVDMPAAAVVTKAADTGNL